MQVPEHAHTLEGNAMLSALGTTRKGLDENEVRTRLERFGQNRLEEERVSRFAILLGQFKSPLVLILLAAAGLAYIVGSIHDALLIVFIVLINTLLGFWQELKALSSIEALKKMTESRISVRRGGRERVLPSAQIVPGDIVLLEEGDIVPADLRLLTVQGLSIDESVLTGESVPVVKEAGITLPEKTLPYELDNMAAFIGVIAYAQGRDLFDITMLMIAEIVSAIPEGLPIVITLVLTVGAMALSRKNTLVRSLPTVETLGSATLIASDKTGTITQGRLIVKAHFAIDEHFTKIAAALANEAQAGKGDPIDTALADWLGLHYEQIRQRFRRTTFYPFDTKHRLMASANIIHDAHKIVVKGAFESLRAFARNRDDFAKLEAAHDAFARDGLRVLALGVGDFTGDNIDDWEIDIVGLIGFLDPPKEDVKAAVTTAKHAGIRLIMVTGDNALTAAAVAEEVGIFTPGDGVLTGPELAEMDDEALQTRLYDTTVWARMLPEHKYRIVKLFQQQGEIVAVTGDGANDIPALKAADLGIAMGSGAEAAKATAKMILLGNDLSVIIEAVRQGRIIADNIRKSIYFLVSTSFDEIVLISGAILLGYPLPLLPMQILWINLVADSALDKTFPFVNEEGDVMTRGPKKTERQFFDRVQIARTLYASLVIGLLGLWLYRGLLLEHGYDVAVSTVFTAMIVAIWVNGLQSLKEHEPFLKNIRTSLTISPFLWLGISIGVLLQGGILLFAGEWFQATLPDTGALYAIAGMAAGVFVLIELRKWAEWWYRIRTRS
ncbi:MAG: cation-transporting P-type ATPase [Campylobacterales bacterium]